MPDTPLNPDALKAAYIAVSDESWLSARATRAVASAAVSAYLAVAQPEVQRKLAVSVRALGLVASLHTPVESIELGQECRICSIPSPCMTRRVADEALQAIERKVKP